MQNTNTNNNVIIYQFGWRLSGSKHLNNNLLTLKAWDLMEEKTSLIKAFPLYSKSIFNKQISLYTETYCRETIDGAALRSPIGVSNNSMAVCSSSFLYRDTILDSALLSRSRMRLKTRSLNFLNLTHRQRSREYVKIWCWVS